ncbi:MAG: DUF2341 domain-containing protein, partial [Nanoarchaeota archaeon]|nr:DUF2341 domain-containing protein [Nanoarchaeota archaeon]
LVDISGPLTSISAPANFTNISAVTYDVNATAIDAISDVDTVSFMFRENGSAVWQAICSDDMEPYSCSWDLTGLPDANSYELFAYSNDTNGFIGENHTSYNITIDHTGPVSVITSPQNSSNISVDYYFLNASISDALSSVDAVTFMYQLADSPGWNYACSDDSDSQSCLWDLSTVPNGYPFEILAYANDTLGNTGANYTIYNITILRKAVYVTLDLPMNNSGDNDGILYFDFNVTGPEEDMKNCTLNINGQFSQENASVSEISNTFVVAGLSPAKYFWNISCSDTFGNNKTSDIRQFSVVTTSDYSGKTTNLSLVEVSDIENFIMENPMYGMVNFTVPVDLSDGLDLNLVSDISNNYIDINSEMAPPLNKQAILQLYNLYFIEQPVILRNFGLCEDAVCTFISYSGNNLTFNVSEFSSYSATNNTILSIYDNTDILGGNQTVYVYQNITFYANYTNYTSGEQIGGADVFCEIDFDDSAPVNMTFNSTDYYFVRNFTLGGTYNWTVFCNGSAIGAEPISLMDDAYINGDTEPPIVILDSPANLSWTSASKITFYYNVSDNNGFNNCSLYINGEFNQSNSTIYNNQKNNFSVEGMSDGENLWYVSCIDLGLLENSSGNFTLFVDTTGPAINLTAPSNGQVLGPNVDFSFLAVDALNLNFNCSLMINSSVNQTDIIAQNNSEVLLPKSFNKEGTYFWNITCSDNMTNTNASETYSFTVTLAPPTIFDVYAEPNYTGIGQIVLLRANVTDSDGVSWVRANVTMPNQSLQFYLYNTINDEYEAYFNSTWRMGQYNYTITASDMLENENISESGSFTINSTASMWIETEYDIYGPNQIVNLTAPAGWWNSSWSYRIDFTIPSGTVGSSLTDFPVLLKLDSSNFDFSKLDSNGKDIRFVSYDNSEELDYEIERWNTTSENAELWVRIPMVTDSSDTVFWAYYGNLQAEDNQDPIGVWNSSYLAVWHMNALSGNVFDSTDKNNGTNSGALLSLGQNGYAMDFVQTDNDYINMGQFDSYEGQQDVVFEAFFRTDLTNSDDTIFAKGGSGEFYPFIWRDESASGSSPTRTKTMSTALTGTGNRLMFSTNSFSQSVWYYLTIVFDGSSQELRGYKNGVEDAFSPTSVGMSTFPSDNNNLWIGRWEAGTAYNFDGLIDELRISNVSRSSDWIDASYLALNNSLIAYGTSETLNYSSILNFGSTTISGYLTMTIETNYTGSWLINYTVINDTVSGKMRNLTSSQVLELSSIWNGPGEGAGWDTGNSVSGYYRAKVLFTDPVGTLLEDGYGGLLNSSYIFYFDITPPVWYFTNATDFTPAPDDVVNFSANWSDNLGLGNWEFYWKIDGDADFSLQDSGSFSGLYNWSIASMTIPTGAEGKAIWFNFRASDMQGASDTTNISNISVRDVTKPVIANDHINQTKIYRNQSVNITAVITDNIALDAAWLNVTLPDSSTSIIFMGNISSNYSVTYSFTPLIGLYNATIFANDTSNNLEVSSVLLQFEVFGLSNVTYLSPIGGSYPIYSMIDFYCMVSDHNTTDPIGNYPIEFYVDTTLISTNLTNSSGIAKTEWNITGEGYTPMYCKIANQTELYYDVYFLNANSSINILVPDITLVNIVHENNITYGVDEYETFDIIDFADVTVNNTGGLIAHNVEVTLNVLDSGDSAAPWFTKTTNACGNLDVGGTCATEFNNSDVGYNITDTANTGTHKWNIDLNWSNGGSPVNNYLRNFVVYHIPDEISGEINDSEINAGGNTTYTFNLTNPWSKNLSGLNVTINCPAITGLSCSCINQPGDTCYIGNALGSSLTQTVFNITTTASTPLGDFGINLSFEYNNPGNTIHQWNEVLPVVLKVKPLVTFIVNYPASIVRAETLFNITGYARNIGQTNLTNLTLNWTLPVGWENITGGLELYLSTLEPETNFWNNITVNTSQSLQLGVQEVRLETYSPDANYDDSTQNIAVYARTNITYLSVSDTNPYRGDTITVYAKLDWDNSSGINGETIYFQTSYSSASNTTGWAVYNYQIPAWAPAGTNSFTINASYSGSGTIYSLSAFKTINISVRDSINITVAASPKLIGYGNAISIYANATSGVAVDTVRANISIPGGSLSLFKLQSLTPPIYVGLFNSTWKNGKYNYTIIANNTGKYINTSDIDYFEIRANSSYVVNTNKLLYGSNEIVNLTYPLNESWWNNSYLYRASIDVTNLESTPLDAGYTVNITLDTTGEKFLDNGNDIRIIFWNSSYNTEIDRINFNGFNQSATTIWFKTRSQIPGFGTDSGYYIYYGNEEAGSPRANGSEVYLFYDDFESYTVGGSASPSWQVNTGTWSVENVSGNKVYRGYSTGYGTSYINGIQFDNISMEMRYYVYNSSPSTGFNGIYTRVADMASTWNTGSNTGYMVFKRMQSTNDVEIYRKKGGTLTATSGYVGLQQWIDFRHDAVGGILTHSLNGVLYNTYNDVAPDLSGYLSLHPGRITADYDLIRIRYLAELEPTAVINSEEPQYVSKLNNTGITNFSGYLILIVEFNNSGTWETAGTVVDDTVSGKLRNISTGHFLNLEVIWNGLDEGIGFDTLSRTSGQYRAVAKITDPSKNILYNDDGTPMIENSIFIIDTVSPVISLLSPANDSWLSYNNITFSYMANDTNLANCSLWGNWSESGWQLNMTEYSPVSGEIGYFSDVIIPDGTHIWAVECFDLVGHFTMSSAYELNIDNTPPTIALMNPGNNSNISYGAINFTFTADDNFGEEFNCTLLVNDMEVFSGIIAYKSQLSGTLYNIYTAGEYNWTMNCSDQSMNSFMQTPYYFTVIRGPESLDIRLNPDNETIFLNWTAVPLAESYNVYITHNLSLGFGSLPNATGITDLNYTDIYANESSRRYYRVGALRGEAVANSTQTAGKHEFALYDTWNLVTVSLNKSNWLLYNSTNLGEDIFTSPDACIDTIWRYNAENDSFEKTDYVSGQWVPAYGFENFTGLDPTMGYWFEANKDCNATFVGIVPEILMNVSLDSGWNVAGWFSVYSPELFDASVINPANTVPADAIQSITRYNAVDESYDVSIYYPAFTYW